MAAAPPSAPFSISEEGLAELPLRRFADTFARILPQLLRLMRSAELKQHPRWGRLVPFDVEMYGNTPSIGHICRPDIVLTNDGPRITEIDFVPSGRGWTLMGIPTSSGRYAHLNSYRQWYQGLGIGTATVPVYYATGTTTVCEEERDLFARGMQRLGLNVQGVNIDSDRLDRTGVIDRLFYRSELKHRLRLGRRRIITAEPWFDSKMIFAVIHDKTLDGLLTKYLGTGGLRFLRQVMIPTRPLADAVEAGGDVLDRIVEERARWVLKSTEVEVDWSWGARSVVLGNRSTRSAWSKAVRDGVNPSRKVLGSNPIIQPFCESLDFRSHWDAIVNGKVVVPDPAKFGKTAEPKTRQRARHTTYARIGPYFLVNNQTNEVIVPHAGVLTLRQDPLAHGAGDAIITAFQLV